MRRGLIIGGSRREYLVYLEDGSQCQAAVRKALIYNSGQLFIGDRVQLDSEGLIAERSDRHNRLIRPRIANVSYGAVVASTCEPSFSSYLLDKYLAYLLYSEVTPLILFSKIDRLTAAELKSIAAYRDYYHSLGIESFLLTTADKSTFKPLKKAIADRTVVFMGQTGAGKSSIINALAPHLKRAIGEYSIALGRGKHQTKEVALFPFEGGFIGDTPGFSSLELPFGAQELAASFPGFASSSHKCYYNNCLHQQEKQCTIKARLASGELSKEAYENYLKMLAEIKEGKR